MINWPNDISQVKYVIVHWLGTTVQLYMDLDNVLILWLHGCTHVKMLIEHANRNVRCGMTTLLLSMCITVPSHLTSLYLPVLFLVAAQTKICYVVFHPLSSIPSASHVRSQQQQHHDHHHHRNENPIELGCWYMTCSWPR